MVSEMRLSEAIGRLVLGVEAIASQAIPGEGSSHTSAESHVRGSGMEVDCIKFVTIWQRENDGWGLGHDLEQ